MKTSFITMQINKNGFVLSLILKVTVFGIWKWPSFVLPGVLID